MKKYIALLAISLFMPPAIAGVPPRPSPAKVLHSDKDIYIDITEVYGPDGSRGTSYDLNVLVSQQASRTHSLKTRFISYSAPDMWKHVIRTYDRHNIKYKPGYKKCSYNRDALACGILNKHWTILTHVTVGSKYSTLTMSLYNERGQIVASSQKTAWGYVRWVPNWKLTKRTDSGGCQDDPMTGGQLCRDPRTVTTYEEYPPEMKELPPLITPYHVHQVTAGLFLSLTRDFVHK